MKKKSATARTWKNPLFVTGARAQKLGESLRLGEELRRRTAAGLALGTFVIELPTPATLTAMALAGFDFVVLDMEHSPIDFSSLEHLIFAAHAAGLPTLVRTWGEDSGLIGKVLDMGADGIMAPHVDTPERAREIVEQARFAPLGHRGFSPLTRFDALREPLRTLSESTYVVIQIEGRKALNRVSQIAAVPGIDTVFVGPYDLALSLNVPPGSPEVLAAAERVADAVPNGVGLGLYLDDPAKCGAWAARRFSLQCVSFDGRMLSNGARAIVNQARHSAPKRRRKRN
jgi:2-keto-3-deoxy-L-rhamnonate aldolase RhmA